MRESRLIVHSITFTVLVVACIFIIDYTQKMSLAEDDQTSHRQLTIPINNLQADLHRMLPVLIGSVFASIILGVLLQEWLSESSWFYKISDFILLIFAGIPSVLYGILCVYFFVLKKEESSHLVQSLSVVLLTMPIGVQTTQNAVKSVDVSIREAAYALGVNKFRIIADHVIPRSSSKILSGICVVISRGFAVAAFIIVISEWINHTNHGEGTFNIPNSVFPLILIAVLCSVFSSILKKGRKSTHTHFKQIR